MLMTTEAALSTSQWLTQGYNQLAKPKKNRVLELSRLRKGSLVAKKFHELANQRSAAERCVGSNSLFLRLCDTEDLNPTQVEQQAHLRRRLPDAGWHPVRFNTPCTDPARPPGNRSTADRHARLNQGFSTGRGDWGPVLGLDNPSNSPQL